MNTVYMYMRIHMKSQFWEKSGTSDLEMSLSCTTWECDNVSAPYYPISALKWSLMGY